MPPDLPVRELLPQSRQVRPLLHPKLCPAGRDRRIHAGLECSLNGPQLRWTGRRNGRRRDRARRLAPHRRSRSPSGAPTVSTAGEGPTPTIRTQSVAPAVSAAGVGQSPPVCGFVPDSAWQPILNRWSPIPGSPQRPLPMPFRPEIQALVWSGLAAPVLVPPQPRA
jgi:hypothetical protein